MAHPVIPIPEVPAHHYYWLGLATGVILGNLTRLIDAVQRYRSMKKYGRTLRFTEELEEKMRGEQKVRARL